MKCLISTIGICAVMFGLSLPTIAQEKPPLVLQLEEIDQDGSRWTMEPSASIVDINSTVVIRLEPSEVRKRLARSYGVKDFPEEELERLIEMQQWARQGIAALPAVEKAMSTLAQSEKSPEDLLAFEMSMHSTASYAEKILKTAVSDPGKLGAFVERGLEDVGPSVHDSYRIVFEAASDYTEQLTDSLDARISNEAVYIVLGAWIRTNEGTVPLHLAGFDAYPQGEFHELPRWNVALTEEQREQIDRSGNLARDFNAGKTDAKRMLESMAANTFSVVKSTVDDCTGEIQDKINTLMAEPGDLGRAVRDDISGLADVINAYVGQVSGLVREYSGGDSGGGLTAWLNGAMNDVNDLTRATDSLALRIARLGGESGVLARFESSNVRTRERVQDLRNTLLQCAITVIAPTQTIVDQLRFSCGVALSGDRINTQALEFGEQLTRHDIASLPSETKLDLRYTGKREPGDAVVFKLGAGRIDPEAKQAAAPLELHATTVQLHRVLPHIETTVGLVFVDPLGSSQVRRRFQAAPAYSILLKSGSRSSVIYNRLINPGIGLNVTALDFDKDDVPEPGIALVASIFRDYIQAGFGYNLFLDTSYWFFGTSLPLINIPIPGGTSAEK